MPPRVSVLITAYQAERHLATAVRSALAQTMADLEVVVVDNGCTDGTGALALRMTQTDRRVKLITLAENRGPSGGRNAALAAAKGEWVAPLDADDAFAPDRLAKLLAKAAASRADMVSDNLLLVDYPSMRPRRPALSTAELPGEAVGLAAFLRSNDFSGSHYGFGYLKPMLRRKFLSSHAVLFRPDLNVCEDFHFYLDCLRAGARWHCIAEPLYLYALRPGSQSHDVSVETLQSILDGSHRLLTDRSFDPVCRQLLARRHRNLKRFLALVAFRRALRDGYLRLALEELRLRPSLLRLAGTLLLRKWLGGGKPSTSAVDNPSPNVGRGLGWGDLRTISADITSLPPATSCLAPTRLPHPDPPHMGEGV